MVEKFKKILKDIEEKNGEVYIFALLKMDEFFDKWSVVICAPWATTANRNEAFDVIKKEILNSITEAEVNEIARLGIFEKNEHLIEELLKFKSETEIKGEKINGNIVHEGYIIKSKSTININTLTPVNKG